MTIRRRGLQVTAAAAALLLAGFAAGEALGWPWLAQPLAQRLSAELGRELRLLPSADGERPAFHLRLLGRPTLQAARVQLADLEPRGAPLLDAQRFELVLRWRDLLALSREPASAGAARVLNLHRLSAERLQLHAWRDASGRANWDFGQAAATRSPAAAPVRVRAERVQVGQVAGTFRDAGLDLVLAFQLRLQSDAQPALQASADGSWRGQKLEARLQAESPLPLLDPDSRDPVALQLRLDAGATAIRFDGSASDLLGQRGLRGELSASGPSLAPVGRPLGLTLPSTPPFRLRAVLQHAVAAPAGVWQVDLREARVGASDLAGSLRFDSRPLRPLLEGTLRSQRMRLVDLGPAIGGSAPAGDAELESPPQNPRRVLPQRQFDLPSLRAMDADVRFTIAQLVLDPDAELQPLSPLAAWVRLSDGVLQFDDLQGGVAQGRLSGRMQLDARDPQRARWDADLNLAGMRLEYWVPALREERAVPWATGRLSAALRLRGDGRSTAELLATADGNATLLWQQGRLSHLAVEAAGLDVAQGLGRLIKGDEPLAVRCGAARLLVQNGKVQPQPAVVDTADSTLWLTGELSLASEALDLRVQVAPRDRSLLTLRAPLRIQGSLGAPQFGVDGSKMAQRLVPSALLALANPLAALIPLLDAGDRDEAQAAAAQCSRARETVAAQGRPVKAGNKMP